MPTQKFANRNVRKLIKIGNGSLAMTLPVELVTQLRWKEKQKVIVTKKGNTLIIKDWKK